MNHAWSEANQRRVMAEVRRVRAAVERHLARDGHVAVEDRSEEAGAMSPPAALDRVVDAFGLSPFERDILILCAGVELDAALAGLCAGVGGPTFGLALAALTEGHWSALAPDGPLRKWRLIELQQGRSLTAGPLRAEERVLHFLAGVPYLDARVSDLVAPLEMEGPLAPSHRGLVDRIVRGSRSATGALPVVVLGGVDVGAKRGLAAAVAGAVGLRAHLLRTVDLPASLQERMQLAQLWTREAALADAALVIDADEAGPDERQRAGAFAQAVDGLVVVCARDRVPLGARPALAIDVETPGPAEQEALWRAALGPRAAGLDVAIGRLVAQFNLSAEGIQDASRRLGSDGDPASTLWQACRLRARSRLDDLAPRVASGAHWDDLVLPEGQRQILVEIGAHVRQRATVHGSWGFSARMSRGLGISALFVGPSGTGKTMAAEALANDLGLDLYRIDLSQVVSKYIGETEKNLRRVFDAAEAGGAVLLFDEADALFGKRSEVKDSHDRYANIEVSYLLQRMEAYRGLAILTSNLRHAIDPAFLRRIRFVVTFPFPEAAQRAEIWRRAFPPATPTDGLDPERLGRLQVAGGNIANIALAAAVIAAEAGEPVRMAHVMRAAKAEFAKLEKPFAESHAGVRS